jgi:hypothetical protein
MIQESTYWVPARTRSRASVAPPPPERIEEFSAMLRRAGRGRIRLRVDIRDEKILAAQLDGPIRRRVAAVARD